MDKCQKPEMVSAKVGLCSFVLRTISPNMREITHPPCLCFAVLLGIGSNGAGTSVALLLPGRADICEKAMAAMATFDTDDSRQASKEREFHLVDLISYGCGDTERPEIGARLCEIEEALKSSLRAKIAEIESVRSTPRDDGIISQVCALDKEVVMSKDERDILELLRTELDFLEQGGYGRSVRTPWKATSPFRDSLTCVNYGLPEKAHPCSECHLIDFVPPDRRADELPCHHIPLNDAGDTAKDLELSGNQAKLEESLKEWLRAKIKKIETARLIMPQPTQVS